MAIMSRNLPPTLPCPETGKPLTRDVRPLTITYKGASETVDMPGYYPEGEGESVHVGEDMRASDEALARLKQKVDGVPTPEEIRRVRKKLKLTQREAGELLKVGENAFDKYERGLVAPSGPTAQLIRLLDKRPELVRDLA